MIFTYIPTYAAFADVGISVGNLYGGNIPGSNVSVGNVSGGNVSRGDVTRGNLYGGNISGSNVSGGNVSRVNVSDGDISGTDVSGTDIAGSDLPDSVVSGSDISDSASDREDYSSDINGNEDGFDDEGIEEYYIEQFTIYNLENEEDTEIEPEEEAPLKDPEEEEGDSEEEIYGDESFDEENAAQLEGAEYITGEIIIKFKEPWQVPGKEKQLRHEIEKVEKVGFVEVLGVYVVKADDLDKNPNAVLNRFKNNKYIEYVEPNYIMALEYIPNDPSYKTYQSAGLNTINAPAGWDIIKGSDYASIAVIDSGVAPHPDTPPLAKGYSTVSSLSFSNDRIGHGTNVVGVIGAIGDNGIGGAGLNWNASIIGVKADDTSGVLTIANVAKAIIWAADNGARIINLSLGATSDSTTLKSAVDYAYNNRGCAIFAAVGNAGSKSIDYPARYSNVMAVGSGASTGKVAYSNYGEGLNVVAGSAYYTTTAAGSYAISSGTSFASPQVAALASLLWGLNPNLTNDQIYSLIQRGASGNGSFINNEIGYGCIDIGKTLQLAYNGSESNAKPVDKTEPGNKTEPGDKTEAIEKPEAGEGDSTAKLPPESAQDVRTPPIITLSGFVEMTLEYGQKYTEMGYSAVDCKGLDITSLIKVTGAGAVDIWKAGLYAINYEVTDAAGLSARVTRIVTVNKEPAVVVPHTAPKITIIGSNPIILHSTSGTAYKEQGAKAVDYDGKDISSQVKISGSVNRTIPGNYTITYTITSPETGLSSTTTRVVRIVSPNEKKEPRVKYGLSGQAKQGAVVTHTGIVSGAAGFLDLHVSSIDKNMTITAKLIDTTTKKVVLTDTFTAAGTKQYTIDKSKYELAVSIDKANGNSKYSIDLQMPETATTFYFNEEEVPLGGLIQIAPIGSDPIILHLGGTPYREQGARASDFFGNDLSDRVEIIGAPDTETPGAYKVTYRVANDLGVEAEVSREVRILAPNEYGIFEDDEVPVAPIIAQPNQQASLNAGFYVVVKGDSLWQIALKVYGDGTLWRQLYDLNKDVIGPNPNRIYIGQVLTLAAS